MTVSEAQLIGRLLDEPKNIQSCDLRAEEITNQQFSMIYSKILEFVESNQPINPFSISEALEVDTGQSWLSTCVGMANDAKNMGDFAANVDLVRKHSQIHGIQQTLTHALECLNHDRDPAIADKVIEELMTMNTTRKNTVHMIDDVVTSVIDRLTEVHDAGGFLGVKSGLTELDETLGGFHPTDLVIVAARPAVGKTALALNFANSAATKDSVLFFSGEQGHEQIGSRMFSIEGNVNSAQMRNVDFKEHEWAFVTNAVDLLRKKKIIICDEAYPKITSIIRTARAMKYEHDIKAIYVDYLQIVESTRTDLAKFEQVGQVARALKALAIELNIPVIVLAQVKRAVDDRNDKRPLQGDISDSSEIEKTADVIMTLYRDDAYPTQENEKKREGIAEILICKNRHGPTGVIDAAFRGEFMQFKDLDYRYSETSHYG